MFSNDITLAGDASSSTTYALRGVVDGKSIRGDASAPLGQPKNLTISHSVVNKAGGVTADRHLVRLDRTVSNGNGESATASVYAVIESPRSIVAKSDQYDLITQLNSFLGVVGNRDKLFNNEP